MNQRRRDFYASLSTAIAVTLLTAPTAGTHVPALPRPLSKDPRFIAGDRCEFCGRDTDRDTATWVWRNKGSRRWLCYRCQDKNRHKKENG